MQLWVSAIMLFNMGVGITAEYTALGNLFSIVIGSSRIPIVVIVGVVSSIYTGELLPPRGLPAQGLACGQCSWEEVSSLQPLSCTL